MRLLIVILFFSTTLFSNPVPLFQQQLDSFPLEQQLEYIRNLSYDDVVTNSHKLIPILHHYEQLAIERGKANTLARIYFNLCLAYYFKGKYDENLKYGLRAIQLYDSLHDRRNLGIMYGELGYQTKHRDLAKAFDLMRKGISVLEEVGDNDPLSSVYNNFGVLHELQNQYDSASFYYRKALSSKIEINDSLGIPYCLDNIFTVMMITKQYDSAFFYLDQSTRIRELRKDSLGLATNFYYYGQYYNATGDRKRAIDFDKIGLDIALKHHYTKLVGDFYQELSVNYESLGSYREALNYYKLHVLKQDSIVNKETNETIAKLQIQFETEEKEKALLLERAEKEKMEKEKYQAQLLAGIRQKWIWGISLLGVLIVSTILILMQMNLRKVQQEKDLALIEEQEKGITAIIYAQEEERKRVAKDLHDGIGQQISAVNFTFQLLVKKIGALIPDLLPDIEKIKQMILETGADIRNVSHQMMPRALTEFGLVDALEDMIEKSLTNSGITCQFEHQNMNGRLLQNVEIGLYRISQELINNIIKHSKAKNVYIHLIKTEKYCELLVHDDGQGFISSKPDGIGLLNMNSRINALKGEFHLESDTGNGTTAKIRVKL